MFTTSSSAFRTVLGTVGTLVCAGVCLVGAAAPALAETAPRTATVSYSDLNLASSHGRDTLDARIKAAARRVCAEDTNDLRTRNEEARCIRSAVSEAQARTSHAGLAYQG